MGYRHCFVTDWLKFPKRDAVFAEQGDYDPTEEK